MRAVLFASLFALTLPAQQDMELHEWMETANRAMNGLKKLESKTGKPVVGAAERIGGIYEDMINYWRQKGAADAVKWSEVGKAAAVQFANAASGGDMAGAEQSFKALDDTCTQCHNAHRERIGPGKYRIK